MSGGKLERIGGFALKMIEETVAARDAALAELEALRGDYAQCDAELDAAIAEVLDLRAVLREILDRINADIDLEDGKPVISDELFERAKEMCK